MDRARVRASCAAFQPTWRNCMEYRDYMRVPARLACAYKKRERTMMPPAGTHPRFTRIGSPLHTLPFLNPKIFSNSLWGLFCNGV